MFTVSKAFELSRHVTSNPELALLIMIAELDAQVKKLEAVRMALPTELSLIEQDRLALEWQKYCPTLNAIVDGLVEGKVNAQICADFRSMVSKMIAKFNEIAAENKVKDGAMGVNTAFIKLTRIVIFSAIMRDYLNWNLRLTKKGTFILERRGVANPVPYPIATFDPRYNRDMYLKLVTNIVYKQANA